VPQLLGASIAVRGVGELASLVVNLAGVPVLPHEEAMRRCVNIVDIVRHTVYIVDMEELSATDIEIIASLPEHLRPQATQQILRDRRELAQRLRIHELWTASRG
jgi:hypothetical protein